MVKGIGLGADRITIPVDLVEEMSRFIKAVITNIYILLLHTFWPPCSFKMKYI